MITYDKEFILVKRYYKESEINYNIVQVELHVRLLRFVGIFGPSLAEVKVAIVTYDIRKIRKTFS